MIQNEKRDPLRDLNWASVYADVPEDFDPSVRLAFQRIRIHERRKKHIIRFSACAAAAVLCIGFGAWQLTKREVAPDQVSPVLAAPTVVTLNTPVFSTKDDPCLHVDAACPNTIENEVQIQLVTALEFDKTPCSACCANVQFEK